VDPYSNVPLAARVCYNVAGLQFSFQVDKFQDILKYTERGPRIMSPGRHRPGLELLAAALSTHLVLEYSLRVRLDPGVIPPSPSPSRAKDDVGQLLSTLCGFMWFVKVGPTPQPPTAANDAAGRHVHFGDYVCARRVLDTLFAAAHVRAYVCQTQACEKRAAAAPAGCDRDGQLPQDHARREPSARRQNDLLIKLR
jgi:hypothetical protein